MKFWVLALLVLGSACFAQYSEPPYQQVMENNSDYAPQLEGLYNNSTASYGNLTITFGPYSQTQYLNASLDIAGMNLLVDNSASPVDGLALLLARGYSMTHLTSLPEEGYPQFTCSQSWFDQGAEYAFRCDFEPDTCVEYEMQTGATYDLNATFFFGGQNETIPANSTLVEVPPATMDRMRNSSGGDNLTVLLSGNVNFFYQINNRTASFDCADNISYVNGSVPVSANKSFRVAGENRLFFLRSPVLREQWFRNNDFNLIVLSQGQLYRAELYRDGQPERNLSLRTFYIVPGPYGISEIRSNFTEGAGYSESSSDVATPTPLERENHSFLYVYEFNHSYKGLGEHEFSMVVHDSFGRNSTFSDEILSRMLSFGGAYSEDGSPVSTGEESMAAAMSGSGPAAESPSRPSAGFEKETLSQITIAFGLIALVIFLSFFNFWAR